MKDRTDTVLVLSLDTTIGGLGSLHLLSFDALVHGLDTVHASSFDDLLMVWILWPGHVDCWSWYCTYTVPLFNHIDHIEGLSIARRELDQLHQNKTLNSSYMPWLLHAQSMRVLWLLRVHRRLLLCNWPPVWKLFLRYSWINDHRATPSLLVAVYIWPLTLIVSLSVFHYMYISANFVNFLKIHR